jgi:hypothetical protein
MSFDAKDLAIQLSSGIEIEGLWAMACEACASTGGAPRPACQPPSKPCPAPSKPGCAKPSKKAHLASASLPGGLAQLRREMREALARAD